MIESPRGMGLAPDDLRQAVAARYGQVALHPTGTFTFPVGRAFAEAVGYPSAILDALPATASASFAGVTYLPAWSDVGCGEVVVDLGCGAGLDTLIAARAVGPDGGVHAVDFSEEMVALARANVLATGFRNVSSHHAPVEELPLANDVADVVVANGVFNLSPAKEQAISEAHRVLKPGGRLVGAEIVLTQDLPRSARDTLEDWFRWIGGALPEAALLDLLRTAGFDVEILAHGRNARTGHAATTVLTFRATKRRQRWAAPRSALSTPTTKRKPGAWHWSRSGDALKAPGHGQSIAIPTVMGYLDPVPWAAP